MSNYDSYISYSHTKSDFVYVSDYNRGFGGIQTEIFRPDKTNEMKLATVDMSGVPKGL